MYPNRLLTHDVAISRRLVALAATATVMTLLFSLPTSAQSRLLEVGLSADDARTEVAGKVTRTSNSKPLSAASRTGPSMRCWNYGRLILETQVSGFAAPNAAVGIVNLPGNPQKQILDLRSGLCLIE